MASKKVSHSQVVMSSLMLPQHANTSGNVHGGEIMKLMDSAAAVVARRHARSNVVTARVDELRFLHPCHIGDVVTCYGKLTFVGRSSMEVLVTVEVENPQIEAPPKVALTGYFTMVAIDENGRPKKVPELIVETPEEKKRYEEREKIYRQRKKELAEAKKSRT